MARVVVVGGGNAGLCAAMAARDRGAEVTLLERAPIHLRGGNAGIHPDIDHERVKRHRCPPS